jgi:hypothetical protein
MSSIALSYAQKSKLINELGLQEITARTNYSRFYDPKTGAIYTLSPRGYVSRRTNAGQYQVNQRVIAPALGRGRKILATLRLSDTSAITALTVKAVENFRG